MSSFFLFVDRREAAPRDMPTSDTLTSACQGTSRGQTTQPLPITTCQVCALLEGFEAEHPFVYSRAHAQQSGAERQRRHLQQLIPCSADKRWKYSQAQDGFTDRCFSETAERAARLIISTQVCRMLARPLRAAPSLAPWQRGRCLRRRSNDESPSAGMPCAGGRCAPSGVTVYDSRAIRTIDYDLLQPSATATQRR